MTCSDPSPINGQINTTGLYNGKYRVNTTVSFTCDIGFYLLGDDMESTCQMSGEWSPQTPVCIGKNIQINLSCFGLFEVLL